MTKDSLYAFIASAFLAVAIVYGICHQETFIGRAIIGLFNLFA